MWGAELQLVQGLQPNGTAAFRGVPEPAPYETRGPPVLGAAEGGRHGGFLETAGWPAPEVTGTVNPERHQDTVPLTPVKQEPD